ncbi:MULTISPECIES: hypothetical protein [Anoxybacillaceae]|jgi:hypothetical protein|uniref:hypothetical protein n=1 Tax=Anoxybacillaceae TaxID=3120669 RepID=UPI0002FF98BF|nr:MULTISPECIES: hypothetical protein [Parageobacillus]QSB48757.1 hypothetical protein JTI59_17105 [Parageobacillus toebii]
MLAKIKKVKLETVNKNPVYQVLLECPDGNELFVKFDYTYVNKSFMPLEVYYNGKSKGAKLAWYTSEVESMTVQKFLEEIADKVNKKYNFQLKEK